MKTIIAMFALASCAWGQSAVLEDWSTFRTTGGFPKWIESNNGTHFDNPMTRSELLSGKMHLWGPDPATFGTGNICNIVWDAISGYPGTKITLCPGSRLTWYNFHGYGKIAGVTANQSINNDHTILFNYAAYANTLTHDGSGQIVLHLTTGIWNGLDSYDIPATTPPANGDYVNLPCVLTSNYAQSVLSYPITLSGSNLTLVGSSEDCINLGYGWAVAKSNEFHTFQDSVTSSFVYTSGGTVTGLTAGFNLYANWGQTNYLKDFLIPGQTWTPNAINRMEWAASCSVTETLASSLNLHVGLVDIGNYIGGQTGNNDQMHYYNNHYGQWHANRIRYFSTNRKPHHEVDLSSQWPYPDNAKQFGMLGFSQDHIPPNNYWDDASIFYFGNTVNGVPEWENGWDCYIYPVTMKYVPGEPDGAVGGPSAHAYATTGGNVKYQVSWETQRSLPVQMTYEIKYAATSSLHTLGWASGTTGTPVLGPNSTSFSAYEGIFWESPDMVEATNMSVGIHPKYAVASVTYDSGADIVVSMNGNMGEEIQTGDKVTTVGMGALGVPNGEHQVTKVASGHWYRSNGSLTGCSRTSNVATCTFSAAHGLLPGRVITVFNSGYGQYYGSGGVDSWHYIVSTVPSSTQITFDQNGADAADMFGGLLVANIHSNNAISFDGLSGVGSAPSVTQVLTISNAGCTDCGTLATTTPVRFYEMNIPRQVDTPQVLPGSLPAGTVSSVYSQTLTASNFSGTNTWSITSGSLPPGLSGCSSGTGTTCTISGTPTTTAGSPFSFRVSSTDGTSTVDTDYTVTIGAAPGTAPTITTTSLSSGTVGVAYSQTLTATGAPTWTVTTGSLPGWASLNASTGAITGTPNAAALTSFTVTAANGTAPDDTKALSITIAAVVTAKGSRSGVRSSGVRQ